MPHIRFTTALKQFFPNLKDGPIEGRSIAEILTNLEQLYPGIKHFLQDDAGSIRQHINIFLKGELIQDKVHLKDSVEKEDEVIIFQALSGG